MHCRLTCAALLLGSGPFSFECGPSLIQRADIERNILADGEINFASLGQYRLIPMQEKEWRRQEAHRKDGLCIRIGLPLSRTGLALRRRYRYGIAVDIIDRLHLECERARTHAAGRVMNLSKRRYHRRMFCDHQQVPDFDIVHYLQRQRVSHFGVLGIDCLCRSQPYDCACR